MPSFTQFNPGDYPRLSQRATGNSALYTVQTDITRAVVNPLNMNDLVDGTGNGAYSIRTSIPAGSRGFIPYITATVAVGATTARLNTVNMTCTHASATIFYVMFMGRFKTQGGIYANDPFVAGMTNAVNPASYGYWKMLGRSMWTASSGGTASGIVHEEFSTQNPMSTAVATWGGTGNLNRQYISHMVSGSLSNVINNSQIPSGSASSVTTAGTMTSPLENGLFPTHGCEELICFTTFAHQTAGTVTLSTTMGTGTGTVQNCGVAVSFYS